jgi:hypothetical protein
LPCRRPARAQYSGGSRGNPLALQERLITSGGICNLLLQELPIWPPMSRVRLSLPACSPLRRRVRVRAECGTEAFTLPMPGHPAHVAPLSANAGNKDTCTRAPQRRSARTMRCGGQRLSCGSFFERLCAINVSETCAEAVVDAPAVGAQDRIHAALSRAETAAQLYASATGTPNSYARVHGTVSRAPAQWTRHPIVRKETLSDVLYDKAEGEGIAKVCKQTNNSAASTGPR